MRLYIHKISKETVCLFENIVQNNFNLFCREKLRSTVKILCAQTLHLFAFLLKQRADLVENSRLLKRYSKLNIKKLLD